MGFLGGLFGSKYEPDEVYSPDDVINREQALATAIEQQQAFADAVAGQGGLQRLGDVYQRMGQLGQDIGTGPDVAGAKLALETQQNRAQTASGLGSIRGGLSPALLGRQVASQGAQTQQQALGQAALARTQQQLQQERMREEFKARGLAAQQQIAGGLLGAQQRALGDVARGRSDVLGQALGAKGRREGAAAGIGGQKIGAGMDFLSSLAGGVAGGAGAPQTASGMRGMYEGGPVEPSPKSQSLSEYLSGSPLPMAHGRKVPGRARVKGDSPKNDVVPALLSPGEIVVPRSKAKDPKKAAAFAEAVARRSRRK